VGVGGGGEGGGGGGDYYTQGMSLLCPLEDDMLPLEAANLKTKQVRRREHPGKRWRGRSAVGEVGGMATVLSTASHTLQRTCTPRACMHQHGYTCLTPNNTPEPHTPNTLDTPATHQVEVTLAQLKDIEAGAERHGGALEALARLAWSDDGVRDSVAAAGGVKALVAVSTEGRKEEGDQGIRKAQGGLVVCGV
jgi:hypothetical protein